MSTSYTNKNVLIEVLIYTDILIIIHSQINLKPHFSCCGPCTVKCPQAFILWKSHLRESAISNCNYVPVYREFCEEGWQFTIPEADLQVFHPRINDLILRLS